MTARPPSWYTDEAETFVGIMRDMVPELRLDYTQRSIAALEQFIATTFDRPGASVAGQGFMEGAGSYLGEVIIRNLGGQWQSEGQPEINNLGAIRSLYPLDKIAKRLSNGPEDSLTAYLDVAARYARENPPASSA